MRVLILSSFADSLFHFRGAFILELIRRGLHVDVGAPGLVNGYGVTDKLTELGANVHSIRLARTSKNPFGDFVTLVSMWLLIRRLRPDVVVAYTIKPLIYGITLSWVLNVPRRVALVTGLGYAFTDARDGGQTPISKIILRGFYRFALGRASNIIFQNPDDRAVFGDIRRSGRPVPCCVVNGSGVDLSRFSVAPMPLGRPQFLLIARLLKSKGVREFAEAAEIVGVARPGTRFLVVGWLDVNPDSILEKELKAWVKAGIFEYLGRIEDVRPIIARTSVLVLPSYREGTPRAVLEAMAMGRAIITTDVPGCRETVSNGENGYLVPVKDSHALASAMLRLIDDPALVPSMGAKSRLIAEEKYDVRKVNKVMLREMGLL